MGFRFYRRVGGQQGVGMNISKSGVSTSVRTRFGSFGQRGFSIRTPVKGLSFRGSWSRTRNKDLATLMNLAILALFLILFVYSVVYNLIRFLVWLTAKISYLILQYRNKHKESVMEKTNGN